MIDPYATQSAFPSIPWRNGDFHRLNTDKVLTVIDAADAAQYRKPKNANGSRARYFFYAVQRKLAKDAA